MFNMPPNNKKVDKKEIAVTAQVKKFIKNNDPKNIQKRKEYSQIPKVKNDRKKLNSKRRLLQTTLIALLNTNLLFDHLSNEYKIFNNYLTKKNSQGQHVLAYDRKSKKFLEIPYENENDLLKADFSIQLPKQDNTQLIVAVKDLLLGKNQEIEDFVKTKKVLTEEEIPAEECYWKNLTNEEQARLLNKLEAIQKDRAETIIV